MNTSLSISLRGVTSLPPEGAYRPLLLDATAGEIAARYYQPATAHAAVLYLGEGPGFAEPAAGLFGRLAERFKAFGIAGLRLQYRAPADLPACILDAMMGGFLLDQQGIPRVVAVGHGRGAAAAMQVASAFPGRVSGVALLAPVPEAGWAAGARQDLGVWVAHGTADVVVPTASSRALMDALATPDKRLSYYPEADHAFAGAESALELDLTEWLKAQLAKA
jgi:hypothetical protein